MRKKFVETKEIVNWGLATFKCPDCDWSFGLSNRYLEMVGEANVHFNCPYCGKEHGIKKLE